VDWSPFHGWQRSARKCPARGKDHAFPELRIITPAELFQRKKPAIPFVDPASVKRAEREETGRKERLKLGRMAMAVLQSSAQSDVERVQAIFDKFVPGAVCELQDYEFRIGCGALDRLENIQNVVFVRKNLSEEFIRHQAQVLSRKLESGGSTAGPPLKTDC
jgi:hypothetical protein